MLLVRIIVNIPNFLAILNVRGARYEAHLVAAQLALIWLPVLEVAMVDLVVGLLHLVLIVHEHTASMAILLALERTLSVLSHWRLSHDDITDFVIDVFVLLQLNFAHIVFGVLVLHRLGWHIS
jgi:hypothetical protein